MSEEIPLSPSFLLFTVCTVKSDRFADTAALFILLPSHPTIAIIINILFHCDNSAIATTTKNKF